MWVNLAIKILVLQRFKVHNLLQEPVLKLNVLNLYTLKYLLLMVPVFIKINVMLKSVKLVEMMIIPLQIFGLLSLQFGIQEKLQVVQM